MGLFRCKFSFFYFFSPWRLRLTAAWLQYGQKNDLLHQHYLHGFRSTVCNAYASVLCPVCDCISYWKFGGHFNISITLHHCYWNCKTVSKLYYILLSPTYIWNIIKSLIQRQPRRRLSITRMIWRINVKSLKLWELKRREQFYDWLESNIVVKTVRYLHWNQYRHSAVVFTPMKWRKFVWRSHR